MLLRDATKLLQGRPLWKRARIGAYRQRFIITLDQTSTWTRVIALGRQPGSTRSGGRGKPLRIWRHGILLDPAANDVYTGQPRSRREPKINLQS